MTSMKIYSMFDGVGGFTIGLNNSNPTLFKTTHSNQYEPSKKSQDAYEVGVYRFPDIIHDNRNVETIPNEDFMKIRDSGVNMITAGFPCQDYSVARSRRNEMGIEGKKGVLFWEIIRATRIIEPEYLILENVDRLLKAPSNQRGRDFAVMLSAFNELNYSVEWRVINAAEYGQAQRRRRVFFFIYRNNTSFAKRIDAEYEEKEVVTNIFGEDSGHRYRDYVFKDGLFARQFPIHQEIVKNRYESKKISNDIVEVSNSHEGRMWNTGVMRHGIYYTYETMPIEEPYVPLSDIIQKEDEVDEKFYIDGEKLERFHYLRGPKKKKRVSRDGYEYIYSEGGMSLSDSLSLPGRTMLTSEGSINRSTHLLHINGRYRLITPIEAERMQDFPDDWTRFKQDEEGNVSEVSSRMRLFFMGNALVTGIVKRIGDEMAKII